MARITKSNDEKSQLQAPLKKREVKPKSTVPKSRPTAKKTEASERKSLADGATSKAARPSRSARPATKSKAPQREQITLFAEVSSEAASRQKNEVVLTPVLSATPVLHTPEEVVAPEYQPRMDTEAEIKKVLRYSNMLARDDLIAALAREQFGDPDEVLQKVLPAALRGSDILLLKPEHKEGFLVGVVTAAQRILSEQIPRGALRAPAVLFLSPYEKKVTEAFQVATRLLGDMPISCQILPEGTKADDVAQVLSQPCDVLFVSLKTLREAQKTSDLQVQSVGLCFVQGMHQAVSSPAHQAELMDILKSLPAEKTQKIFVSQHNSALVRECAYQFLDDPECFSFLPVYVNEKHPRQFAHALTVTKKFQVLLGHLVTHKPQCAVVFANTKSVAEWIAFKLHGNKVKVELVTSALTLQKRMKLVQDIQSQEVNIIVTTDHLSKVIGLEKLNCIYHFDLPENPRAFVDRLNRLEGSKNPLSIAFICEDYGFNMGAIEELLGFKIHINQPDKNYFNIPDNSEYPLESDGRVKRIGATKADEVREDKKADLEPKELLAVQREEENVPVRMPAVHADRPAQQSNMVANDKFVRRPQSGSPRPAYNHEKGDNKFVRRDERARHVVDAAKLAAHAASERRDDVKPQQSTAPVPVQKPQKGVLSLTLSLFGDAAQAAVQAARQSMGQNIDENMPKLAAFLKKYRLR